jgi:hypothetical protein
MRSREKRNLVSSKDEKNQHRVRVLLGAEIRLGLINKEDTRLGIGIMDE